MHWVIFSPSKQVRAVTFYAQPAKPSTGHPENLNKYISDQECPEKSHKNV